MRRGAAILIVLVGSIALAALSVHGCGQGGGDPAIGDPAFSPIPTGSDGNAPDLLAGAWAGSWKSHGIHGGGKLRCTIRRQSETVYLASFVAKYGGGLFSQSFPDVPLDVRRITPARWEFSGSKDLGMFSGGVYTFEGHVTPGRFHSDYEASLDDGVFKLERKAPPLAGADPNESGASLSGSTSPVSASSPPSAP
jgi:hypothetical protein